MKTKEQIQKEMDYGTVMTSAEFKKYVDEGFFISYDGTGYYHDGQEETDICVWKDLSLLNNYPYVCWYNK